MTDIEKYLDINKLDIEYENFIDVLDALTSYYIQLLSQYSGFPSERFIVFTRAELDMNGEGLQTLREIRVQDSACGANIIVYNDPLRNDDGSLRASHIICKFSGDYIRD